MAKGTPAGRNFRVGFQLSIVTLFTALVLAVGLGLIILSFDRASAIMRSAAQKFVDQVSDHVADRVKGEFDPVLNEIGILARLPAIGSESIGDDPQLYALLVAVLRQLPQLYNLYAGYGDGNFIEIDGLAQLPPDRVAAMNAPANSKFRLVLIEDRPGQGRIQSYHFLDDSLTELAIREQPASYDPRTRPWYQDAFDSASPPVTQPYLFGAGVIGYTARQSLTGSRKGVVAGDILLDETDRFLEQQRLGRSGVAVLFNRLGNVVAHPQLKSLIARVESQTPNGQGVVLPNLDTLGISGLTDAVLSWRASGEAAQFFESDGRTYVASFRPVGASIAQGLDLAVIAPLDEFFEEIVRARWQLMLLAVGVVIAAIPVALWLGRVLSHSVRDLVQETERIQRFDFSRPIRISSIIREIDDLGASVATMKTVVRAFANFVPKSLVQRVVETGAPIDLGGTHREVSILFTDIENFTGITEGADAERVMLFTSRYLAALSDTIMRHHGTVDKFVGDAVMALWNAPSDDPDHVEHACEAMLDCRIANRALDPEFAEAGWPAYHTRYGLHVGAAIVGNVGSNDRMNYTALGQTVNLAARLESLNKQYHTEMLVSQQVRDRVADRFAFRIVDEVQPKGFASPVPVFELRGTRDDPNEVAFCTAWEEIYPLLHKGDAEAAVAVLTAFAQRYPDDPVCHAHLERMRRSAKLRPNRRPAVQRS
jgi:adenylate cyclase